VTPGQLGDARVALALVGALPAPALCIADTAYDSDGLRQFLAERGTQAVIPNNPTRKRLHPFDPALYKHRNRIERIICRLKDWRRLATRYDKLARNYLAAIHLAIIVTCWL
jgi:transposase